MKLGDNNGGMHANHQLDGHKVAAYFLGHFHASLVALALGYGRLAAWPFAAVAFEQFSRDI